MVEGVRRGGGGLEGGRVPPAPFPSLFVVLSYVPLKFKVVIRVMYSKGGEEDIQPMLTLFVSPPY